METLTKSLTLKPKTPNIRLICLFLPSPRVMENFLSPKYLASLAITNPSPSPISTPALKRLIIASEFIIEDSSSTT